MSFAWASLRLPFHNFTRKRVFESEKESPVGHGGGGDMDGADGRRVMTCAASWPHDKTIINPIMLRFRPIAPKPAAGDSSSGNWKAENKNGLVSKGKVKGKYVRVKKNNECYKRRKKKTESLDHGVERDDDDDPNKKVLITLQLLPEKTDPSPDPPARDGAVTKDQSVQEKREVPMWFNFNKQVIEDMGRVGLSDLNPVGQKRAVVETWVTVESVTDTCMDNSTVEGLGCTDVEKMKNLEKDTCPGFISDSLNRVKWVNEAYKKMVRRENDRQWSSTEEEITVWLVIKDKVMPYLKNNKNYSSMFTCWVRLQYTWQKEKCSQMVPCDVWRMDYGGCHAWRLDVKASLSLGL